MKAKKHIIDDETFGRLTHVVASLWGRSLEVRMFDQISHGSLYVSLPKEGGRPEPNQVAAYKTFSENLDLITRAVEKAIMKEYAAVKRQPRPTKEQVAKAIEFEAVTFPWVRPSPTFGFLFKCDWQIEHGLAVKVEDGKVTEVGLQDIVL